MQLVTAFTLYILLGLLSPMVGFATCEDLFDGRWKQFASDEHTGLVYTSVRESAALYQSRLGMVPYVTLWGRSVVFGDPICKPQDTGALLSEFLENHGKADFVHISLSTATYLKEIGYAIGHIGDEAIIDLQNYGLSGPKKRNIRAAMRSTQSGGYQIREWDSSSLDEAKLRKISDEWLAFRQQREDRFLNRPFISTDEPDVRKFVMLDSSGEAQGFAVFDPIYREGRLVGYYGNHKRSVENAPKGWEYSITVHAMEVFRQEGLEILNLGLLPSREGLSGLMAKVLKKDGIGEHKRAYGGDLSPIYYAVPSKLSLPMAALRIYFLMKKQSLD